jgi:hypothetical protein
LFLVVVDLAYCDDDDEEETLDDFVEYDVGC